MKKKSKYKQMAFETAVRNPERYIGILKALKDFEGEILDDQNLLTIVSHLYLVGEVSSRDIDIKETTRIGDIQSEVIEVNRTRRADGGFPKGYQARFWTYMRTPSELGFVFAQYGQKLKFSNITKKLINDEIDEQEAFSIQAIKYNRKSPYRNVSNDFNFFRFILEILLRLKEKNKSLSYEQFIVAMFSLNGDVNEFLSIIRNNKFKDYKTVDAFIRIHFKATTKMNTITNDYPDVVRRLLIISGFISIRYEGKKLIQVNENKLDYIKELLKTELPLSDTEKLDPKKYFNKLNANDTELITLITKYRKCDKIDGATYKNQISDIIERYNIDEKIILQSIANIGTRNKNIIEEFKDISEPLKLEFYISILIAIKYGDNFYIRPNYKVDHIGKPYSHAPGKTGDIEVYSSQLYWLIEVTLIRNRTQQLNHETTNVIRHLFTEEFERYSTKYLSFVAPIIHEDVRNFYNYSVVSSQIGNHAINMKPYTIDEFSEITRKEENFDDMEKYTQETQSNFKEILNKNSAE